MLTTQEACHSMPPVEIDYTPKGTWMKEGLTGLKTYASTPGESKKAILYIYDIGGFCDQNYQGADMLASQGFHVYIPDLMKGGNIDFKTFLTMKPELKQKRHQEFSSGFPGKFDTQFEPFRACMAALKDMGYETIGGAGFCWGGNLICQIPELDAIAMIHPGKVVSKDTAANLEVPTCLLPSMNEDEESMESFHKVMLTKSVASKCILKWYRDMPHGWCAARADLNSEEGRAGFKDAFEVLTKFFKENL